MHEYTSRFFHQGETIFAEGMSGDAAYLVRSGRVSIVHRLGTDEIPLADFGPGDIFGEMAIFMAGPRTATATMMEAGDLIILPKDRFNKQLDQVPPMIRSLLQDLMARLQMTTDRLRPENEVSLFLSVCRILALQLEKLQLEHAKGLPYREALRLVKDILQVSASEVEGTFFKLHELGLINCLKDGLPNKSLVFLHPEGFLAACERHYHHYADHMPHQKTQDRAIDFIDLPTAVGLDPDILLDMARDNRLPIGLLKVSQIGLRHWMTEHPQAAAEALVAPREPGSPQATAEVAATPVKARPAVADAGPTDEEMAALWIHDPSPQG